MMKIKYFQTRNDQDILLIMFLFLRLKICCKYGCKEISYHAGRNISYENIPKVIPIFYIKYARIIKKSYSIVF